jgi:hypothetical protein
MRELAVANPRRGRRYVMDLLRKERWSVGTRLMKRLWRKESLLMPQKRGKRRRIGTGENGIKRRRALLKDEVWGMDFVQDELLSSETFDTLAEARHLIDRWRLFYNHRRIQRALGKMTPAAFAHARGNYTSARAIRREEVERIGLGGRLVQFADASAGSFLREWVLDQADLFSREDDPSLELPDFPANGSGGHQ